MIYCQTINKECIAIHPFNDTNETQFVELVKYGDATMFAVWMNDGEVDWIWEFEMSTPSDYERVKMNIFDAIFECESMNELAWELNDIFEDEFSDILVVDECDGCEGCEGCSKYKQ